MGVRGSVAARKILNTNNDWLPWPVWCQWSMEELLYYITLVTLYSVSLLVKFIGHISIFYRSHCLFY